MKRYSSLGMALVIVASLSLGTMGFQCSSPNITSGKLYYQQYQNSKDPAKLDAALQAFEKEAQEKPNSAEAWYWIGMMHGEMKQFLKLHESWEKSKSLGEATKKDIAQNTQYFWGQAFNTGASTFKKAQIKKDAKLYQEAAETFRAATLLMPDSSAKYGGYINYAFALMAQDKYDEAIVPLEEQLRRHPNADAYRALASIYTDKARLLKKDEKTAEANAMYDKAIATLNEAMIKFPDDADLNQELLNTYIAAGRLLEATPKFKEFAEKNPSDKSAQYAFGTVLLEAKDFEQAVVYLKRAAAIDPGFDNAHYNICVAYLRWGVKVRDDEETQKKEDVSAYKGIIQNALPSLETLLKSKPDVPANWDLAGKIYASLGMTKEAQAAYEKLDALRKEGK